MASNTHLPSSSIINGQAPSSMNQQNLSREEFKIPKWSNSSGSFTDPEYVNPNKIQSRKHRNDNNFNNNGSKLYKPHSSKEEGAKKKRTRTSPEQLQILQQAFAVDPMPNSSTRAALAEKLGMNVRAIQIWFQNRRAKGKLDQKRNEIVAKTQKAMYLIPYADQKMPMDISIKPSLTEEPKAMETLNSPIEIPEPLSIPLYVNAFEVHMNPGEEKMDDARLVESDFEYVNSPLLSSSGYDLGQINNMYERGLGLEIQNSRNDIYRRSYSMPNVHQSLSMKQMHILKNSNSKYIPSSSIEDLLKYKPDENDDEVLNTYIDVPDDLSQ